MLYSRLRNTLHIVRLHALNYFIVVKNRNRNIFIVKNARTVFWYKQWKKSNESGYNKKTEGNRKDLNATQS